MKHLVIGDAMIDVWTRYEHLRPNPEDRTTSVVRAHGVSTSRPGGACNVATNLAALGEDVTFFTPVRYQEREAALLRVPLGRHHVTYASAYPPGQDRVTTKTRLLVGDVLKVRVDDDCAVTQRASVGDAISLTRSVDPACVIITDYEKGGITFDHLGPYLAWLTRTSIRVVIDAKVALHRALLTKYVPGWWVLKANAAEARQFLGPNCTPANWADAVARCGGEPACVITKGAEGAYFWQAGSGGFAPAPAGPPATSVCGAGDVVTAILAREIALGASLPDAARYAVETATRLARSQRRTLTIPGEDVLFTDHARTVESGR